ncbi:MAG: TonB-dependent receptor [Betaproteobacteria bacterium]|nr:MAG: TonB-dependent receptor [Betaproteobacteria bacterium]
MSIRKSKMAAQPSFQMTPLAGCLALALASGAMAQTTSPAAADAAATEATSKAEVLVITGSRIKAASLTATSPVSQFSAEDIAITRSVTVEDFSVKLPQLAGGANSTSAGSDAFGAQTLDLRNLGQNRTLVLINGTRAVPFSFRNAVDVNFMPAPLLKRVDVLTGGAAAVYGADAMAGVVNFIINDNFRGAQANLNYRHANGGASQSGFNLTGGMPLGNRGSVVGYFEYTERGGLLAGERDWAIKNSVALAGNGGNFTDVASGRTFSVTDSGAFSTTPQTTNYTSQYTLVQPLKRLNASAFFKYDLNDNVQTYGRLMLSNVRTNGAPTTGQAPVVLNGVYNVSATNPFIPADARGLLTFVDGVAKVNINRSLGEVGVKTLNNDRDSLQAQMGVRGALTDSINWDVYAQSGRTQETIVVNGDVLKSAVQGWVNTADVFGAGADASSLQKQFTFGDRERKQSVYAATVSGDTTGLFKLPAGPVGFSFGAEMRREDGRFVYNQDLPLLFNQGIPATPAKDPYVRAKEVYGELLIPVLRKLPFVENLSLEGALRSSSYDKSVGDAKRYTTDKIGASWAISEDFRVRATEQSVIREPNFGEFANPTVSIPFANLVNVARLRPRYAGDPCALGTGNAEQCRRFNAPAVGSYNSLDPNLLTGGYFFGGNADIRAEKGKTKTVGAVITPRAIKGLSLTLDYYTINISDAVGQVQPVDALSSCYITDPRADNPLCKAVTRNATTGRIENGLVNDRNLAFIKQSGYDLDLSFKQNNPFGRAGERLTWQYQAAIVRDYAIQKNPVLAPVDCKGTYGSRCSSDLVSLVAPAYRHRASLAWEVNSLTAQVGWKRVGKVRDSAVGSTDVIAAQDYFDVNFAWRAPVKGLTLNFGIDNVANKQPPTPKNAGTFNTYPDTYNVMGRSFGVSLTYKM